MHDTNLTILLVEDDPDQVFFMQRAFAHAHLATPLVVAKDGEEAIMLLSEKKTDRDPSPLPALMLLDLKMPRKSGFEVLEWMRDQSHLKSLTTIVLTSSDDPSEERRAYSLGAHSFITKPMDFAGYLRIVESLASYSAGQA